jgi:hypothetical protein
MAIESPLFQSSMELLGHSISHFNGTGELDRKLLILHLANAVELILKDVLLDLGESIYKNPKETVTATGCMETLKARAFAIPFHNKIELLFDERNALQHRFGSPNELTTIFYMNISIEFFREVLRNHYTQDFDEVIAQFTPAKDLAAFVMHKPTNESELEKLKKLSKVHPLGALLSVTAYLEGKMAEFTKGIGLDQIRMGYYGPRLNLSTTYLGRFGIDVPADIGSDMEDIRRMRNYAAHGRKDPTREEVIRAIDTAEKYERFLDSIDKEKARQAVAQYVSDRKKNEQSSEQPAPVDGGPAATEP